MILINSNNVTLTGLGELDLEMQIQQRGLAKRQFTGSGQPDGTIHLTFPMSVMDRAEFAPYIHRHNAELRAKNPHLDPKDPGPKGTPPTGGSSGAGRVVEFENTVAIAA